VPNFFVSTTSRAPVPNFLSLVTPIRTQCARARAHVHDESVVKRLQLRGCHCIVNVSYFADVTAFWMSVMHWAAVTPGVVHMAVTSATSPAPNAARQAKQLDLQGIDEGLLGHRLRTSCGEDDLLLELDPLLPTRLADVALLR
jgi:hypothetical protein